MHGNVLTLLLSDINDNLFLKLRIYKIYQLNTTIIRLTKLGNEQLAVRYTKQA